MGKFIEEFYYGNLDPQARSTKQNKTVQKQMEVLMLNEDFLTENLSGESKKKFLDFVNAWGVVNGESNLDSFIMGFRLGANFTFCMYRYRAHCKLCGRHLCTTVKVYPAGSSKHLFLRI